MPETKRLLLLLIGSLFLLISCGATESMIPQLVWWTSTLAFLGLLIACKYAARRHIAEQWRHVATPHEMRLAKSFLFLWFAIYALAFIPVILIWYTGISVSIEIVIPFFAAWIVKSEIWALLVLHQQGAQLDERSTNQSP